MPTTEERDEIRLLAEEIKSEYFNGGGPAITLDEVAERVLRKRLVPATAYSLPVRELRVGGRKEG